MQATETKPAPKPLNGVNTPTLFATINAVAAQPELARFRFRASHRWVRGTHSQGRFETFTGAGTDHTHKHPVVYDFDHPGVLVGEDHGPTPVEFLLIGLTGCIIAGIGNIAAARGVTLDEVTATIEGDMDLRGIFGLSRDVRNGYQGIRVTFAIKGDAPAEKLRQLVEQSRARSAVYDVLTNGCPVDIDTVAA
ncbi:MAG TPA: OsmC family protein [Vicinamibacterales bacterium]|nr:OsmC family protein [Vicinamibacterales bacterium]